MTQPSPWQRRAHEARLDFPAFGLRLDVRSPGRGLSRLAEKRSAPAGESAPSTSAVGLLAITSLVGEQEPSDCYTRGVDLIATYPATTGRPLRTQVYWRAIGVGDFVAQGVELIVSVQTGLLDSDPTLELRSELSAGEVLSGIIPERGFAEYEFPGGGGVLTAPGNCLLLRPHGADWSYLEMVHPADPHRVTIETGAQGTQIRRQLFFDRLEKGVILRARLRGLFVPRAGDSELAATAYADFVATEPPLTT